MKKTKSWGQLTIIDLFECKNKILKNKTELAKFPALVCKKINMQLHKKPFVDEFGRGSLHGLSLMQFVKTSSIIVHTDKTNNRVFVDIFSCKKFNAKRAYNFTKNFFQSEKAKYRTLYRG